MNDELQRIMEFWESLEDQEKAIAFPAWKHQPVIGKKRMKHANHKTLNRHLDWYTTDKIRWATFGYIRRLSENDTFDSWQILDIELQALRLESFIQLARNAQLRVFLADLQSLLKQIAQYLRLKIED